MAKARSRSLDPDEADIKRRKADDDNASTISRACRICLTEVPREIAVFTPCGHGVCRACALKLRWDAYPFDGELLCSYCRREGKFVPLKEELIETISIEDVGEASIACPNEGKREESGAADPLVRECADADADADDVDDDTLIREAGEASASPHPDPIRESADADDDVDDDTLIREAGEASAMRFVALDALKETDVTANSLASESSRIVKVLIAASHAVAAYYSKKSAVHNRRSHTCSRMRAEAYAEIERCNTLIDGCSIEQIYAVRAEAEAKWKIASQKAEEANDASRAAWLRLSDALIVNEAKQKRIKEAIERFKGQNEESAVRGLRFSRACRACNDKNPRLRSFFPACGHAVCRECADKANASNADVSCPTCYTNGGSIPLFEE